MCLKKITFSFYSDEILFKPQFLNPPENEPEWKSCCGHSLTDEIKHVLKLPLSA